MLDTIEGLGRWRTQGIYDVDVAHRLTGVSANSIKRWLEEYPAHIAELKPDWQDLWGRIQPQHYLLSFLEMVEVLIAGKIRFGQGGSYRKVRKYHDGLAAEWGTQFPFAHQNLSAHVEGLPVSAGKALEQLDYEDGFASRWYPLGKDAPLVSEPRISGGAPTIRGRRVRVLDIRELFEAGESVQKVAEAFDLEDIEVETALRYAFLASV